MDPEDEEYQSEYDRRVAETRIGNRPETPAERQGRVGGAQRREQGRDERAAAADAFRNAETEEEFIAALDAIGAYGRRGDESPQEELARKERIRQLVERWKNASPEERRRLQEQLAGEQERTAEGAGVVEGERNNELFNEAYENYKRLGMSDDEARAAALAEMQREQWYALGDTRPTIDQLTPDLQREGHKDEYGDLLGDPSLLHGLEDGAEREAQLEALRHLQGLADEGGYTQADLAMRNANQLSRAAALRQANQAALQQQSARGLGGGGMEMLMRAEAAGGAHQANAMSDAGLQQAAMQRALQAMQLGGNLSSTMYDQEAARRSAIDSFNQGNLDWRRGRNRYNNEVDNQRAAARAQAYQTDYSNRAAAQQGADTGAANVTSGYQYERNIGEADKDRILRGTGAGLRFLGGAVGG